MTSPIRLAEQCQKLLRLDVMGIQKIDHALADCGKMYYTKSTRNTRQKTGVVPMSMLVRKCPKCGKLFWKKEEEIQYADENTLKVVCNHCHQTLRIPLITEGANAGAPKMGH